MVEYSFIDTRIIMAIARLMANKIIILANLLLDFS